MYCLKTFLVKRNLPSNRSNGSIFSLFATYLAAIQYPKFASTFSALYCESMALAVMIEVGARGRSETRTQMACLAPPHPNIALGISRNPIQPRPTRKGQHKVRQNKTGHIARARHGNTERVQNEPWGLHGASKATTTMLPT